MDRYGSSIRTAPGLHNNFWNATTASLKDLAPPTPLAARPRDASRDGMWGIYITIMVCIILAAAAGLLYSRLAKRELDNQRTHGNTGIGANHLFGAPSGAPPRHVDPASLRAWGGGPQAPAQQHYYAEEPAVGVPVQPPVHQAVVNSSSARF